MTHRFDAAPDLNCELGGEWIGNDHQEMRRLCCAFELALQPHQYANSFWNQRKRARLLAPDEWCMSRKAHKIWKQFQKDFMNFTQPELHQLDKVDWWTKLAELGFDREDLLRRDMMDSTDFGETIRMNSAYTAATEYLSSKTEKVDDSDEMDFKVRGGNSRLVYGLAKKIGLQSIRTEQIIVRIREINKRVHVQVEGSGTPIVAEYCVCAIPAHCIIDIDWGKKPPTKHLEAAAQLQYAGITKTAVLCSRRFWPEPESGGYSVCTNLASDFYFDSTLKQKNTKGILCSYAVGDKAVDIASSPQDK